jgi:hypothetical protein
MILGGAIVFLLMQQCGVYDVKTTDIDIKTGIRYYLIENEIGIPYFFSETRFYTMDEYRELKLNKLGI